jgi:hypothetical protein
LILSVLALLELAAVGGIVPLLRRTANFNWHRAAALALLKNPGFRRILLSSLWTRALPSSCSASARNALRKSATTPSMSIPSRSICRMAGTVDEDGCRYCG